MKAIKSLAIGLGGIFLVLAVIQIGVMTGTAIDFRRAKASNHWAHEKAAIRQGKPFDGRGAREVLASLRTQGPATVILPPASFARGEEKISLAGKYWLPLGGRSQISTLYCNETGTYLVYTSDEHGFHNPRGLYHYPVDNLILGDSFAHGACVPSETNAAARLRAKYPKTLTLGFADNGPLLEYVTLREFGPHLKPRTVYWFYYEGNDLEDLARERRSALLAQYQDPQFSQDLFHHQEFIDAGLSEVIRGRETRSQLAGFTLEAPSLLGDFLMFRPLRQVLGFIPPKGLWYWPENTPHPEQAFFLKTLQSAKDLVATWNGQLVFVYLPEWSRFARKHSSSHGERGPLMREIAAIGVSIVDLVAVFETQLKPTDLFPFGIHGHYTEEGYALVAQAILDRR